MEQGYDADGNRVAKGTIQTWGSCDPVPRQNSIRGHNELDCHSRRQLWQLIPAGEG
jgi:hypothetical protein